MSIQSNKTILITGATSGIGKEMVKLLAEQACTLVLLSRNEEKLMSLQAELAQSPAHIFIYTIDLTNIEQIEAVMAKVLNDVNNVDAVINNAGVGLFEYAKDTSLAQTIEMVNLNVIALIEINRILLQKSQLAHVINIASLAGKIATPKASVYAATKHAVIGYTNALRLELESAGTIVTTVNLGPVNTNFFHVADKSGKYQKNVQSMMLDQTKVAKKIISALFKKKREINLPLWMSLGAKVYALSPRLLERALKQSFNKK